MARQKKGKGLSRGPWTATHIRKQFARMGYVPAKHGRHPNYQHPDRPGKIQIPDNWDAVKASHWTFKGLCNQSGYSKTDVIRILNGLDPE